MHGDTVEWFFPTSLFSVWRLSLRRKDRYVSLSVSVKKGEYGQNARNFSLPVTFCGEVILASLVYSCFNTISEKLFFRSVMGKDCPYRQADICDKILGILKEVRVERHATVGSSIVKKVRQSDDDL